MDIAKLSSVMASAKTIQNVQVGMLKKAMDQMEATGDQIAKMIQASSPSADGTVDIKV